MSEHLTIIGGGTMGTTIAKGVIGSGVMKPTAITVTVRRRPRGKEIARALGVQTTLDNRVAIEQADTVLFALKPQELAPLLQMPAVREVATSDKLYISIAGGMTLATLAKLLGNRAAIARCMPNTPCLIGEGMTVTAFNAACKAADKRRVQAIFAALGEVMELPEKHFNTVTGLSGSGPAFAYLIIESLADGGVMCGLPRQVAVELAARTLAGAARMVLDTARHPADLRDDVTTPAGCTIGALLHMEDGRLRSVLARGVEEATRIAGKLSPDVDGVD